MIFEYCILEFSICVLLPHSMLRIILMVSQTSQAKTHWSYPVRWTCLDCSEHWLSVDSISVQCRFFSFNVFLTLFGKDYSMIRGWWYWYFWADIADVELPWGFQILFLPPLLRHVFGQKGLAAVLHLAQFGQRVPLNAEEVCFWMKPWPGRTSASSFFQ